MWLSYGLLTLILVAGVAYSISAGKLTVIAALTGAAVAILVFAGAGFTGLAMMTTFFILGSAATSVQGKVKQDLNAAEKGGRTAGQVLANAGTAALCGILILIFPAYAYILQLMMAASFASATADTLSSELGMVYGRRFFNIMTLKPDVRGLDGVISMEGTLIGIIGSIMISAVYAISRGWTTDLIRIAIAGTLGNLADSVLGAVLERKNLINNNTVNFLNTLIAALFMLLYFVL
ncbi:TIGR00297 family protein [Mucilaginibacter sp. UC70_90]